MTVKKYIETLNKPSASFFLVLLLCGDLIFVALHFTNASPPASANPLLSLETDRGYPEMYQYLKFSLIISMLTFTSLKNTSLHYIAWASVFIYFFCDDYLQVHKLVGNHIAVNLTFIPLMGLNHQDVGELIISAVAGIILLFPLLWTYTRESTIIRKVSQNIILLVCILIFFGVFIDMAHSAIKLGYKVNFILGTIEDGGEMVSVSFILWYTFLINVRDYNSGYYLCDCIRSVLPQRFI